MILSPPAFPASRPRRARRSDFARRLVRETALSPNDFIYPIFIIEADAAASTTQTTPPAPIKQAIASMPDVYRVCLHGALQAAADCVALGIPVLALFPVIAPHLKDANGSEALNAQGLVPRTVRAIKAAYPQLGVLTDVALDPYTSHGQDGVIDASGYILNDETSAILAKMAVMQAAAGVDIVAPSDMMDGRVGAIRRALETSGHIHTQIMAYSAKYASSFYGPFRDAVGSSSALDAARFLQA
jgi:porphobilinogen synthase